jgi:hypothetical protein
MHMLPSGKHNASWWTHNTTSIWRRGWLAIAASTFALKPRRHRHYAYQLAQPIALTCQLQGALHTETVKLILPKRRGSNHRCAQTLRKGTHTKTHTYTGTACSHTDAYAWLLMKVHRLAAPIHPTALGRLLQAHSKQTKKLKSSSSQQPRGSAAWERWSLT